ncbi:MAG TPA: BTAD domain-containing putative transcriptional regulator [Gemmatimonadota bacterium]|nr:BTAD domain-containing putative transcriptional regulator [Gemmatimonadota bacterium]
MLRLRTFGGLTLARDDDPPMTGAATQRRRLAILALLAVARDRGLSRDKILGLLWPESEFDRARHTLNQLLYAQRQLFGDPDLFAGRKTLRLNPQAVWTDVGAFDDALDRGDLEEAVAVYRGPFLDGFFITRAPDFEHWAESQRTRLADRCHAALAALAERAMANGSLPEALRWLGRAFELDPLSTPVATRLVTALSRVGDRRTALGIARRHTEALRNELDAAPEHDFLRLVERLRRGSAGE